MGFWASIAVFPVGYGLYVISRANADNSRPFLTRIIDKYTESQERAAARNDMHVRMIEQAGEDRVLFMNTQPQEYVDMKFPEYVSPLFYNLHAHVNALWTLGAEL